LKFKGIKVPGMSALTKTTHKKTTFNNVLSGVFPVWWYLCTKKQNYTQIFPEEEQQQPPIAGDVYSSTATKWHNHTPRSNHVSSSHFWLFFFSSPLASIASESAKTPTSYQDIYVRGISTSKSE